MRTGLTIAVFLVTAVSLCPPVRAAESPAERAQALFSRDALDSAMAVVDSSLNADSADLQMWMIKADIYAKRVERAAQIKILRSVLNRYPMFPDALIALTRAYLDSGLVDSAASYMKPHLLRGGPHQIEVLYLKGRILESQGRPDSAIAVYEHAHDIVDRRTLLRFPLQRLQQLSQVNLLSAGGVPSVWRLGIPTIFLFWADWSPASVDAFGDIVEHLNGAGISWRFVPINVNPATPNSEIASQAVSRASDAGYEDTVWVDPNLALFRKWNVQNVPTVIVSNINGDIDAVLSGWSPATRSVIVDRYLGKYTDSVDVPISTAASNRTRARYLLASAHAARNNGNLEQAVKRADKAVMTDSSFGLAYASLAAWRWQRGDTVGARLAAYNAVAADPNDLWAMMAVARVEYLHGHFQSAMDNARQCTLLDSEFVPGWQLLGHCAVALGDTDSVQLAIAALAQFNKLDLELPVLQAQINARTDPQRAAALYRTAIEARL